MKSKNILHIIAFAGLLATAYSCNKQLNALPTQSVVDGNLVVDQNSAEIALNGVYYRFANVSSNTTGLLTRWSTTHETYPAMMCGWLLLSNGSLMYQDNSYTPVTTGDWSLAYNILNAANGTIAGVEALPDDKFSGNRKKEILAEARFLRAYSHFFLLSFFGEWHTLSSNYGVMLRKEPLTLTSGSNTPRSTVRESYDFIMQDLDYAIANAAENRPVYYTNKAAAQALKIRVLMTRGQDADYTALIALANELIANPAYALEANLKDLFQVKGLASKEVILGIKPYPTQVVKTNTYEYVTSGVFYTTKSFRNILENDPRASWMLKKAPAGVPAAIKDSFYLSKYSGPKSEEAYVLRLTEVYLLKAEAILRSNGSINDAREVLRTVMTRAGVTNFSAIDNATTKEDLLFQVYLEFNRNMVAEDGIEWFALLRLPFEKVKELRPTLTKKELYIFPIPATEFQLNPAIGDQNPGYPKQ